MNNAWVPVANRITDIIKETDVEYTFTLESSIRPDHGQFVEVSIPGIGEAPISVSGTGDGWIQLTIRAVGHLTCAISTCKVGEQLFIRGPYGVAFPSALYENATLVVAAGGCAVAPVRTLIRSRLADKKLAANTRLLFGFKNPESVLYKDEIDEWSKLVQTIVTIDKEACSWNGRTGLITSHVADVDIPDLSQTHVVIVGPPVMMKYTSAQFFSRGIKQEQIWLSFERRMACGLGKCGHCKIDNSYVCVDGPVFRYDKALHLID
ncbi:MAG: anaerobic sulfite reductase subunit AsrB [Chitinispirillaceae bacterium]|nr:anaerobic sulfite reductase subunit AsrB [Chitinispirillaceae bacterium]